MIAQPLQMSIRLILTFALLSTTFLTQSLLVPMTVHADSSHAYLGGTATVLECTTPAAYTSLGADADAIRDDVNAFRDAIGELNEPEPVNNAGGRRQINWDAAPDGVSAPNPFAGDFFNADFSPRARGIAFTTPDGKNEFQLSATAASGEGIEFENIDPSYAAEFSVYSPERLFTALDNNTVDVRFYNPAKPSEQALVDSFGAIFTDVDLEGETKLRYYDANNKLVYELNVPHYAGKEWLSLAGAKFSEACISRVRIIAGNIGLKLGIQDGVNGYDVVAMDDFIFGEPQPVVGCALPTVYNALGNNADAIRDDVNAFRDAIGPLNQPHPVNHPDGRRQINWDAAPDAVSAPNPFAGDFFNADFFPRARGIAFTTPDDKNEFQLSATAASGAGVDFENIDPSYADEFSTYSPERLFTALDNNVVDVRFYNPANPSEPAYVDSFGAIFTDVDLEGETQLRYYDQDNNLVYELNVPHFAGQEYLSLAGAKFNQACISRVRIIAGNIGLKLGIQDGVNGYDVVAMDDFIYGEPQPVTSCGIPTVFEYTGSNPDEIRDGVNAYRDALGQLNAPAPFNNLDGRRQINWDAAPDGISAPNDFPGNFFNANVSPRARGIAFKTQGSGFQLSATEASGAGIEFNNINKNYASIFQTYSPERLFTPIGSNEVTAQFYNPAQQTVKALSDGFGAVFTDVDLDAETTIGYYDAEGKLIYKLAVAPTPGDEGLSFSGVKFDSSCVSFVKLINGTTALGKDVNDDPENAENPVDLVVMDDFIYGEPTAENVCGTPEIFTTTGADADDIRATVNEYRDALGQLNPFEPTNFADGRRQINWDAAPDAISAPNDFPGDFFNFNASPRARGIEFETNGKGFQLSATEASGEGIEFANINANGPAYFDTYSPERLFTPIGSNELDAFFFDPANQSESALTTGFGAVFTDVDLADVTAIRYYDVNNRLVYAQAVPHVEGNQQETLSFAGLKFESACVGRVRLVNGNTVLAKDTSDDPANGFDVVVMDDFIYGEPQPSKLNVNAAINIVDVNGKFKLGEQENAKFGVFTFDVEFKNVGEEAIKDMSFAVTELSNGNTLLNSTNDELGIGAGFSIPGADLGDDAVLTPGESFKVTFEVGINKFRPFTLLVNAFGSIGEGVDGTVDLGWNYQMDSDPTVSAQGTESNFTIYLPISTQ